MGKKEAGEIVENVDKSVDEFIDGVELCCGMPKK